MRLLLRGGRCAVRRWCGIGCMRSPSEGAALDARLRDAPWGLAYSACVCAGIARERFSCVARCMDAPRTFCVTVPRLCTRRALSAVLWRSAHSARICAVPSIVALALCGGRKGQENYTDSRPLPRIPCFASACSLVLFQHVAALKKGGCQVSQANGVQAAVGRIGHGAHKVGGAVGALDEPRIA